MGERADVAAHGLLHRLHLQRLEPRGSMRAGVDVFPKGPKYPNMEFCTWNHDYK